MQLHEVRTADRTHKQRVRVGRGQGSGIGKTCGRGREGATSRSGWAMKVTYEGGQMPLFRRLPKRGFNNKIFSTNYCVINVSDLNDFSGSVGEDELDQKGLLRGKKGLPIKILGNGTLSVVLTVIADRFSKSAVEKIEAAGGKVQWRSGQPKKKAPNFAKIAKMKNLNKKVADAEGKKAVRVGKAGTAAKGAAK